MNERGIPEKEASGEDVMDFRYGWRNVWWMLRDKGLLGTKMGAWESFSNPTMLKTLSKAAQAERGV